MQSELYYARRGGWQYGNNYPDDVVDTDQVVVLTGQLNDERLIRLGFVAQTSSRATIVGCGLCPKKFVTDAALNSHGKKWHSGQRDTVIQDARPVSREQIQQELAERRMSDATGIDKREDVLISAEERALNESRPVFYEKTEGARKAGDAPAPEVTTEPKRPGRPRKVSRG